MKDKIDYKGFYNSIKDLMRNLGRTNRIYPSEIQDIIDEFEEENK